MTAYLAAATFLGYAAGTVYQPPSTGLWGRTKQYFYAYRTLYWDEAWWTAHIPKAEQIMDTAATVAEKIAIPTAMAAAGAGAGPALASLGTMPVALPAPIVTMLSMAR